MAECYYEPTPATDGATMNPVPGATFQVFEIADTTFSTPLSLRVGAGNPTTTVAASESLATLPGVYVTSPNFEHIWKSGTFQWRRDSIDGAKAAIQDAKVAAQEAAENAAAELSARIAAGEFQGEPGRDGSNVVPTAQAIATEISTEGTPANTALNATTASAIEAAAADPDGAIAASIADAVGAAPALVQSQSGESFYGPVPNVFTNELLFSSLGVDTTGWSASYGGGAGTATRVAGAGQGGSYGYEIDFTTAPTAAGINTGPNLGPTGDRVPVAAEGLYNGTVWVKSDTDVELIPVIAWYSTISAGSLMVQQLGAVTMIKAGTQRRLYLYGQAPVGATYAAVYVRMNNAAQIGTGKITASRPQLAKGYQITPYRDGYFADAVWNGTVGASSSTATLLVNRSGFGAAWGDSMTQLAHGGGEPFPNHLADQVGVPIINGGRGGETSTGVAIRQGGLDLRVTVSGNSIPASGAVSVTVSPDTVFRNDSAWSFVGAIAGISGTLTRAVTTGAWTFTRYNAGTATATLPGTPFEVHTASDYADFHLIWAGHNVTDYDAVLRDIGAMVERARQQGKPFVVLSLLNTSYQPSGSAGYELFAKINAALSAIYGAAFLDVRRFLINHGLTTAGISATAADTNAISEDRVPPSLMFDDIHLNNAGRIVVAKYVGMFLKARNVAVAA